LLQKDLEIFQDLISPGGSRWTSRREPWPKKPLFRMVSSS
jgi:hypothetical protein